MTLATVQVLKSHTRLVATVVDSACPSQKVLLDSVGLEDNTFKLHFFL